MKIPIQIGWLSENGMLDKAGKLLGYEFRRRSDNLMLADSRGVTCWIQSTGRSIEVRLRWSEYFNFTVAQLLELGFEPGEFQYCECCHKLKVDCDKEMTTAMLNSLAFNEPLAGDKSALDASLYEDHVTGPAPATDAAVDDPRDFDQMRKDGEL